MGIMDLSINQEAMGVQNKFGNQVFKLNKFDETDVKGNNNLYNSRKTDTDNDSGSLLRDGYSSENLQVDPSLFSYSSFKKAMDLRTHNRMDDENKRTIFDDADYFAKNFFYKLLPITFEQVDETIIHTEHNYSLFSLNSESETEEDCSRTMDYSQIKKKNYKRRRTKFKEGSDEEMWDGKEGAFDSSQTTPNQKEPPESESETVSDNSVQPLDLSTAPPVQELKTENYRHLREHPDVKEENSPSRLKCIRVTITRPDEKENYQPCDMFLNDIARLVPRLINNDCFEIDILDRTGDRHDDFRKHRLYYIIAESTWQLFQSTRERIILTNDHTLGPPVKIEKDERPTFLVFDQFSLAKCLAEYCEEIGGCFEYTCVEEGKESDKEEDVKSTKRIELVTKAIEMNTKDERVIEVNPEETIMIEKSTEKTQKELIIKSKEVILEEINPETKNDKLDEDICSGDVEKVEIKPEEAANEHDFTKSKSEKFEGIQAEERNKEQIERVDVQINEVETNATEEKEVKTDAKEMSFNLHPKERTTKKKRGKKAEKTKKNEVCTRSMKCDKICTEVKAVNIEVEKTETAVNSDKTGIIAVISEYPKTGNVGTKETKEIEMKTDMEEINPTEKTKPSEMSSTNEKTIQERATETEANKIQTEETKMCDGGRKSGEENTVKATEKHSKKRATEMRETKLTEKSKKFKKAEETFAKTEQARVADVKETKRDSSAKEKALEIKEAVTKGIKRIERYSKGSSETEEGRKEIKSVKRGKKSATRGKVSEELEEKSGINRLEVEKAKSPPYRRIRKKFKSESNTFQTVPHIKTRSQSTSESETSHKPNSETQKPKNIAKEHVEVGTKETLERRTRSGKMLEAMSQDVKVNENGNGVRRRRKRKMVEEERVADKRCLRSRGREKIEEVGTSGKRKRK